MYWPRSPSGSPVGAAPSMLPPGREPGSQASPRLPAPPRPARRPRRCGCSCPLRVRHGRSMVRRFPNRFGLAEAALSYVGPSLERRQELRDLVDRDGEADTDVAIDRALDRVVDADHLPRGIDQRTTRVARIDRRIRLDEARETRPRRRGPTLGQVRVAE